MFEERGPDGTGITREKWLRRIFSGNIEYQHRGSECHFVPAEDFDETPFIVGRMGRKRKIDENEPPASGLKETSRDTWKAAIVLIDPRHHDDGQKIAMEIDPQIGNPFALFSSLAEHINSRSTSEPYYLEVNPITDPNDFWAFELENRGEITSISFGLLAPNMFGIRDDFDKEMRALRDNDAHQKRRFKLSYPVTKSHRAFLQKPSERSLEFSNHEQNRCILRSDLCGVFFTNGNACSPRYIE